MPTVAAVLACLILLALVVFQAFLIAGMPWGRFAAGGQHEVLPAGLRVGSAVSIAVYALIALVLLDRVGVTDVFPGSSFEEVASWVAVVIFGIGIVMNAISRSKPERYTMTPIVAVLCACSVIVAVS